MKVLIILVILSLIVISVDGYVQNNINRLVKSNNYNYLKNNNNYNNKFHNNHEQYASIVATTSSSVATAAALRAVSKLLSTCGIGIWASKTGLLDKAALSVLSKLVFGLLQPCLLFVNVASTVAKLGPSGGAAVTLLPLVAGVQILLGYVVGKIVSLLIYGRKSSEESKQLLTCTAFGNSGPLPLVFVDALLRAHADQSLLPQSVGYVSLYLLGWSPLFWIIAPAILSDESSGKTDFKTLMKRVISPPVLGSIGGLIVGYVPFLRNLLLPANGLLNPVFEAMRTLGAGYLPAVLLVLAGSLTPSKEEPAPGTVTVAEESPVSFVKRAASIYMARFLLMPTVGFGIIKLLRKYFSTSPLVNDAVLMFVFLLETCMPSAQNSTVILQLQNNRAAATRMAKTLMFIYILGVPAMSFWIIKILQATNLL